MSCDILEVRIRKTNKCNGRTQQGSSDGPTGWRRLGNAVFLSLQMISLQLHWTLPRTSDKNTRGKREPTTEDYRGSVSTYYVIISKHWLYKRRLNIKTDNSICLHAIFIKKVVAKASCTSPSNLLTSLLKGPSFSKTTFKALYTGMIFPVVLLFFPPPYFICGTQKMVLFCP